MLELPSRYAYLETLAQGGAGQVHRVFDRDRGAEVALKVLEPADRSDPQDAAFLFRREFWALTALQHPNLIAGYDFALMANGTPFFTMELVAGHDLDDAIPQSEDRVRGWLAGVLSALGYLHARGFVHGDISPRNIRCLPDGQAKLMDLGLLAPMGRLGGPIRGSLFYMAPEAIRQGTIDGRADLYGLGAVVFHALTGRAPFAATTTGELLRAHVSTPAPALQTLVPEVSEALCKAVADLMAKSPADRPADAAMVAARLGLAPAIAEGGRLYAAPLLGRDAVSAELASVMATPAGVALLSGPHGVGKSRLLADLRASAQLAGLQTIAVQGGDGAGGPYQAIRPWLLGLAGLPHGVDGGNGGSAAIPDPIRDRLAPILVAILPELAVAPAPPLDARQARSRLHAAIADWVEASQTRAVWIIDDADRLDAASADLLTFLRGRGQGLGWNWLLAAVRPEDVADIDENQTVRIDPLSPDATGQLARALLGGTDLSSAAGDRLFGASEGLPAAVEAILEHWGRTGTLVSRAGRWEEVAGAPGELPSSGLAMVGSGFRALSLAAQRVGAIATLLGTSLDARDLADVCAEPDGVFFEALADLERAGVIGREGAAIRLVRPEAAEIEAASWPAALRAGIHGATARRLAARVGSAPPVDQVLDIARHHLLGDEPLAALPWVEAGARRAVHLFVPAAIEGLLVRTLTLPSLPADAHRRMQAFLGEVWRMDGRTTESLTLLADTVVPAMRAAADPGLGDVLVTVGILEQVAGHYDRARAALEEGVSRGCEAANLKLEVRARTAAARAAFFTGDPAAALAHLERTAMAARLGGLTGDLGTALAFHGYMIATSDPARLNEGLAMVDEATALDREIGNEYGVFEALNNRGDLCLNRGRMAEATAAFTTCLELTHRLGFSLERCFVHLNLGAARLEGGDVHGALEQAAEALIWSRRQGRRFPEAFALALQGLARVYLGEPVAGVAGIAEGLAIARAIENRYLELLVLVYAAEAELQAGRGEEAARVTVTARALAVEIGQAGLDARLARVALAVRASAADPADGPLFDAGITAAMASGEVAECAYGLRWRAEWRLALGDGQGAVADLERVCELAANAGLGLLGVEALWLSALAEGTESVALMRWDVAQTRAAAAGHVVVELACGAAIATKSGEVPEDLLTRCEALLAPLTPENRAAYLQPVSRGAIGALLAAAEEASGPTLRRARLFAQWLAEVADQPGREAMIGRALAVLVELTGADEAFLLLYDGLEVTEQFAYGTDREGPDAFGRGVAYEVLWSGRSLVILDAPNDALLRERRSVEIKDRHGAVVVPLLRPDPAGGQVVIGALLAISRLALAPLPPEALGQAQTLAKMVAALGDAGRLASAYRGGYEVLEPLFGLALGLLAAGGPDAWLEELCRLGLGLTGADRAVVLVGPDLSPRFALAADGQPLTGEGARVSVAIAREAWQTGRALHVADVLAEQAYAARASVQSLALRTVSAIPATWEGEPRGVLVLDSQRLLEHAPAVLHALDRLGDMVGAVLARES